MKISATRALLVAASTALLALASCSSSNVPVSLDYQPQLNQGLTGPRVIAVGRFADMRRESGSYTLGTVRSPIGTPMETLTTRIPVEDVVRNAFMHGLSSRNMLTSRGESTFILTGELLELSCQQMIHPSASARVRVNLVRVGSGQILFSRIYQAEREGPTYHPGSGSPVPALRDLTSRVLQNVVDRALDDQQLRAKLP